MKAKEIKKAIRKKIGMFFSQKDKLTKEFIRQQANSVLDTMQKEKGLVVEETKRNIIIGSICDDFLGLGPLQKLIDNEKITEIMVNGPYSVYIERDGKKMLSDVSFDDKEHLSYIIEKMLTFTGRRVDESSPYVDFSLADGSRVNIILPPLAASGPTITVRKFLRSIEKVEDLVQMGTLNQKMADFLIACVKAKLNVLFSGATGSGKTTSLEVLSSYINPSERIITIEDALELHLQQNHVVSLLTRPPNIEGRGEVSPRDLFRNTLRMRPTRIIIGEIRGAEAMDYLQALNSGHRGSLAVIHASEPVDALTRIETMAMYADLNLPAWAIRKQLSQGLDLIVQQEQFQDGSRKINYITEVGELKDDQIVLRDIFTYEVEEITEDFKVVGSFKAKNKPSFFNIFKKKGIKVDENIFV